MASNGEYIALQELREMRSFQLDSLSCIKSLEKY